MKERADDFQARRAHLAGMSDEDLRDHFWTLVDRIVAPLVAEARTHTSPAIERAVLLRMGFSSLEARPLVEMMLEKGVLGRGAGRIVLSLATARGISVRDAGLALLDGRHWEEVAA